MTIKASAIASWCVGLACVVALTPPVRSAQPSPRGREGTRSGAGGFQTAVPEHSGTIILARPTDSSVTLSILLHARSDTPVYVAWGLAANALTSRTDSFTLKTAEATEIVLRQLRSNTLYHYQLRSSGNDAPILPEGTPGSFHTARPSGAPFVFAIQADSHLDESVIPELYRITLGNELADHPDFLIDLGDTFMTGQHTDRPGAAAQYLAQRYWLGQLGWSVPLFLVLGNHDGETVDKPASDAPGGLSVWAHAQRTRLFPNPVPNGFYTGNVTPHANAGPLGDYFAWTWGDALFVVLDPYWYSRATRGGADPWGMTLGREQYDWLARTLRASSAKYKLVFIHQLVGGLDEGARGGAEAATLYEWGGRNRQGVDEFAQQRPGWAMPIHQLLQETGVQVVFHGHDHFFAHQQLDGITYQLVPQPAHRNFRNHQAAEYGYRAGDFLPNSGHLRVRVAPDQLTVEYIRSADERMARQGTANGQVAFTYTCPPRVP